jgi:hypothetical protein
MERKQIEQPTVVSIGLDEANKVVIRLRFSNNSIRDVATNTVSFAFLAQQGVPVFNAKGR